MRKIRFHNQLRLSRRVYWKFLASLSIIILLILASPGEFSFLRTTVYAQSTFTNLVSYRVNSAPNYTAPGSEAFWQAINWTNVPLAATVSPGGGHTSDLLVKSANNGFDIYMLFRWNDSAGPSFLADQELYTAPNGSLVPLTSQGTANATHLFYNSTYYYPDRVAVLWFVANQSEQQQSPKMMLGSDGAITGGAAEIWHWQSNPTDNNPNDTGFPGGYTDPASNPIYPQDNLSFAEDDYTNTTGFFVIAGNFGSGSPNLDPYADPYIIHVGSYYSHTNKTWTVEMVRSFTTSDASNYRVQLRTDSSYYIAMAVWQGKLGESSEFKSVSLWYNLTVSNQVVSPKVTATATSSGGISVALASAVAIAAVITGLVIGTVVRSSSETKKIQREKE